MKGPGYRLPGDLRPISYDLEIKPDIVKAKFEGQVNISAVWASFTEKQGNMIKLNAHQDIIISDVKINLIGTKTPWVKIYKWKRIKFFTKGFIL